MHILMLSERPSGQTSSHCDFLENLIRRFNHAGMILRIPHHTRVLPTLLEERDISLAVIDLDSPNRAAPIRTIGKLKTLRPGLPVITLGGPHISSASIDTAVRAGADIHLQVERGDEQSIADLVDCAFELASGNQGFSAKAGWRNRTMRMGGRTLNSQAEPYLFIEPEF